MKRFLLTFCLLLLVSPVFAQDTLPENFDVQGHRGARGLKPENTLPAFETALDLGVTTLELDLHYTADGVVIIWHDDQIPTEKCGVSPDATLEIPDPDERSTLATDLNISALTWEQLQAYRCDRNPEPDRFPDQDNSATTLAGDDYHIPSLDELFAFVEIYAESDLKTEAQRANAAQVLFNIETKRKSDARAIGDDFDGENPGAFELAILDVIADHDLVSRIAIQSFDHRSLWAIRSVNDSIQLVALTTRIRPDLDNYAEQGASVWSPNSNDLTQSLLDEAHDLGLLVIPWTVNDADDMRELIAMGVDGIITDRPDILLNLDDN